MTDTKKYFITMLFKIIIVRCYGYDMIYNIDVKMFIMLTYKNTYLIYETKWLFFVMFPFYQMHIF